MGSVYLSRFSYYSVELILTPCNNVLYGQGNAFSLNCAIRLLTPLLLLDQQNFFVLAANTRRHKKFYLPNALTNRKTPLFRISPWFNHL